MTYLIQYYSTSGIKEVSCSYIYDDTLAYVDRVDIAVDFFFFFFF